VRPGALLLCGEARSSPLVLDRPGVQIEVVELGLAPGARGEVRQPE
jgi:hypothetical protein